MRAGFFAKVVELQQRYRGNKIIANSLQTNGILLNDKWARFLRRHGFLVGLSIDGPASLHDTLGVRRAAENPPGKKVVQAIRCLQQHDVPVNAMVVVSRQSASRESLYRCLSRELNLHHLQFIPLVDSPAPWSVTLRAGAIFVQCFRRLAGKRCWQGVYPVL